MKYELSKSLNSRESIKLIRAINKVEDILREHNYNNKQIKKEINRLIPEVTKTMLETRKICLIMENNF